MEIINHRPLDTRDIELTHLCQDTDLSDDQILALFRVRAQLGTGAYSELTPECKRLAFWRRERERGRLSDGEPGPHAPTWRQVVAQVQPDLSANTPPSYSGAPSSIRQVIDGADEPEGYGG